MTGGDTASEGPLHFCTSKASHIPTSRRPSPQTPALPTCSLSPASLSVRRLSLYTSTNASCSPPATASRMLGGASPAAAPRHRPAACAAASSSEGRTWYLRLRGAIVLVGDGAGAGWGGCFC